MNKLFYIFSSIIVMCSLTLTSYGMDYKSIKENDVIKEDTTKFSLINKMITEKQDLEEYLKDYHSQANKDRLFLTYYMNLGKMTEAYSELYYTSIPKDYKYSSNGTIINFYDIDEHNINYQYTVKDNYIDNSILIANPYYKDISFNEGESGFFAEINNAYLRESYKKYLSKQVNDFLTLQATFDKNRDGIEIREFLWIANGLYEDGPETIDKDKISKIKIVIDDITKFKGNYPQFPLMGLLNFSLNKYQTAYNYSTSDESDLYTDEFKNSGFSKNFSDNHIEELPEFSYLFLLYIVLGVVLITILIVTISILYKKPIKKEDKYICPFCNEKICQFTGICPICGENISIIHRLKNLLK